MKCIVCYLQLWKHFPSYCWEKKLSKKKRVITFSDYLPCESASSAALRVTVCLTFHQFYTISHYVKHMSFFFFFRLLDIWRISAEFPPSMRCACLSRPSVSWPFTNQSLKLSFILIGGMRGKSISHFWGRALSHPLFQSGFLWLHPFGPMQPGRAPVHPRSSQEKL